MSNETTAQKDDGIFELKRKENPDSLVAIRLRETVCDDRNVSDGAARMFVRLLDLALNPNVNHGLKGRVVISQKFLATRLHCRERSIRRYTAELCAANYFWTQLVPQPGTKPIYAYSISIFRERPQVSEHIPGSGLSGNGRRRHDHGFLKKGVSLKTGSDATEQTGHKRPKTGMLFDRYGKPVSSYLLGNTPVSGQESPLTADNFDRSQRTELSPDSGQNCPLTEDRIVRSQRSELSADRGRGWPI